MSKEFENNCKKSIEHLKKEMAKLRSGRASASLLDGVQVEYYGATVPLIQLGMINTPEPRVISIQVYDGSAVDSVEKAIRNSGLGLNPSRDGSTLRINIPALTNERRKELLKVLNGMKEDAKVGVRAHRREEMDVVKASVKNKDISEDEAKRAENEIQKITTKYESEIDVLVAAKEKEMSEI